LVYADDVNIVGENIDTVQKKQKPLDASKEVGLVANPVNTKYVLVVSRCQKAEAEHKDRE
jgi:hypothetical protein